MGIFLMHLLTRQIDLVLHHLAYEWCNSTNNFECNCNLKITRQIDLVLYFFAYEWCNLTIFFKERKNGRN